MIIIDLPVVKLPRINDRYNKNFSLKKSYRERKDLLRRTIELNCRGGQTIKPPYAIMISVGTHLDIDSYCKPLIDSMQEAGVIDNDKNVLYLCIDKISVKRNEDNWIIVNLEHFPKRKTGVFNE